MAIISREKKICFTHVPRTGGKIIKFLLEKQISDLELIGDLHLPLSETIKLFPKVKDYYKFAYVRNPYDRLVSIYSQLNTESEHPDYGIVRNFSLFDFVKWIGDVGMKRKKDNNNNLPIYYTQTKMVYHKDKLLVDDLFYYEKLCNDMDISNTNTLFFKLELEIPNKVPLLNKSERHIGWLDLFDTKTYSLINKIFAEDFKNFNYEKINGY